MQGNLIVWTFFPNSVWGNLLLAMRGRRVDCDRCGDEGELEVALPSWSHGETSYAGQTLAIAALRCAVGQPRACGCTRSA
jgi:hypothetical protein